MRLNIETILKPSNKQLNLINNIQYNIGYKFTGNTKEEANAFISLHIDEYKFFTTMNNIARKATINARRDWQC